MCRSALLSPAPGKPHLHSFAVSAPQWDPFCTVSPSVSPTPPIRGASPSQAPASGAGTPSHSCTEAGDQQFLPTFRPDSIHNYKKRKEAPDLSDLTKNRNFLRDLVCAGLILPASFFAGLTSHGAYRELENTWFLLKSVVSDKFHDCVLLPHLPPLLMKAQTGLGHVAASTGLFTALIFSFH